MVQKEGMSIDFSLITPCFAKAFDSPEMRTASLKGILRYWWRATNYTKDVRDLFDQEAEIFGGAGDTNAKKSSFSMILNPISEPKIGKAQLVPHPNPTDKKYQNSRCIYEGSFTLTIIKIREVNFEYNHLVSYMILGSVGQRARRGMGSLQIDSVSSDDGFTMPWDLDDFKKLMEGLNVNTETDNNHLEVTGKPIPKRPVVKRIYLSAPKRDPNPMLEIIAHAKKSYPNRSSYNDREIGGIGPKFASPIWIRLLRKDSKYKALLTVLHNPDSNKDGEVRKYVDYILNEINEIDDTSSKQKVQNNMRRKR